MNKVKLATLFAMMIFGVTAASSQMGTDKKMKTALTGAAEVPGPGDSDGSGKASVSIKKGATQVCYDISVSKIGAATMAHIHEGASDVAGPAVLTLMTPGSNGKAKGCVDADAALIERIRNHPDTFYVNVHTAEFADGAVRGQLGAKMMMKKND